MYSMQHDMLLLEMRVADCLLVISCFEIVLWFLVELVICWKIVYFNSTEVETILHWCIRCSMRCGWLGWCLMIVLPVISCFEIVCWFLVVLVICWKIVFLNSIEVDTIIHWCIQCSMRCGFLKWCLIIVFGLIPCFWNRVLVLGRTGLFAQNSYSKFNVSRFDG